VPPVDQFAYDLLPTGFRARIADIAERLQCPPDYPAVGSMVAAAAVIGRQIEMRPKRYDDWTVTPNL
jgi:putative DNA primase/helicase